MPTPCQCSSECLRQSWVRGGGALIAHFTCSVSIASLLVLWVPNILLFVVTGIILWSLVQYLPSSQWGRAHHGLFPLPILRVWSAGGLEHLKVGVGRKSMISSLLQMLYFTFSLRARSQHTIPRRNVPGGPLPCGETHYLPTFPWVSPSLPLFR